MNYKPALNNKIFNIISSCADELHLECYVIGGYVRDYILNNNSSKDIDIVVVGNGVDFAKKIAAKIGLDPNSNVQIFKTYGTAMFKYNGIEIEFVGARKESYNKDSRNPVVSTGTLQDDQNRRDFTINALALSLNSKTYGNLIDPFNGINDLNNKIIKTPLSPEITYNDDPLRMLRAIRFASKLNFTIEENSFKSIEKLHSRIKIITQERIIEEINKIILSKKPSIGFLLLDKSNLLNEILPELTDLKGIDEIEGQTHKDNFYHTLEVLDNISKHTNDLWLRWAALLHDVGKAPTKKFDKKIGWTFHGHEYIGSKMVKKIFQRLSLPLNETLKYVQKIVMMSSRPIVISEDIATDSAVRRLIYDAGNSIDDLLTLCEADITTKNIKKSIKYQNNFKIVRKKITDVEERDSIRNFQPPITGEIVMEHYKIKPCKEIGIIKEKIKNAILDGEIQNDYNEAFELMIKIGKSLGLKDE